MKLFIPYLRYHFVKKIYGDHNSSKVVRKSIKRVLAEMPKDGFGLNIGSGETLIHPRIKNLEIYPGENIDYVGKAESIPVPDQSFDLVICQEVLEHTKDFEKSLKEMNRILKPNGQLYLQVPFIIGYHPCPNDYWRFTHEGIERMVLKSNFLIIKSGESVGAATGFYRISVEFFSIFFSIFIPFMYKIFKGVFAIFFYPIKWLDTLMSMSKESHRISGGFYVICIKDNKKY
jgi:SAM-dependent methyltransferase